MKFTHSKSRSNKGMLVFLLVLYTTLLLWCFMGTAQQVPSSGEYRTQLNAYHWKNDDFYRSLDSAEQVNGVSHERGVGTSPELYNFNCQDLWLSGANIAWNEFGRDVGNGYSPDINYFNTMFAAVKNSGGNSMRWWLHTNVSFSPDFNSSGQCTGMAATVIPDMEAVLDAAYANGIALDLCLFSFDMLQDQWNMDRNANKNFLTSQSNIQTYVDDALTPMVNALKDHPALLCWEVFNEPEGMTTEFGWTDEKVAMSDVQRVVNMVSGAIHRLDTKHPVTNGAWSFRSLSDNVTGTNEMNYYRDDRLIAAGGDQDGTLDFYQVHYYNWAGTALSPFHHDKSYWGLNKPLMVAEYHVEETFGVAAADLYDELYHRGYFGGWGWQYNETDLWADIQPAMQSLQADHNSVLAIDYNNGCSGGGDDNIVIRAQGANGDETLELEIDGTVVATWTMTTNFVEYSYDGASEGVFRVNYTNDATDRDVVLDWLSVDGVTYQAEDQAINTSYYANGSCGGGSHSDQMHCNGYIEFVIGGDSCADSDNDGLDDCRDKCPNDPTKFVAGLCGCGVPEGACPTGNQGLASCHTKFLGNIMPSSWQSTVVRADWGDYWNQVSPENAGKWGVVEGSRDNYSWNDLDLMYDYAQTNDIPFKQHVFVWGSQQPNWMAALSTSEQIEEVEEWYSLFAQRYPNTEIIDVVNESIRNHAPDIDFVDAIGGFNNGASQPYLAANSDKYGPYNTGWDYIIYSFAKAREYFPDAILVLNDYGIISDPSAITEHLEIVEILKNRGLIDAVGVQCHHFNMNNLSASNLQNNLDQLATSGLPIHITELDMNGTEQQQRDRYADKFPVFWEHPAVTGVTIWGYVEGQTWENGTGLLNSNGSERLAMTWLKEYLDCNGAEFDCNGVLNGTAYYDECEECVGGNTGLNACVVTGTQAELEVPLRVFPNPSTGIVHLSEVRDWKVFDLIGNEILNGTGILIDIQGAPRGSYFIRSEGHVEKIILQ